MDACRAAADRGLLILLQVTGSCCLPSCEAAATNTNHWAHLISSCPVKTFASRTSYPTCARPYMSCTAGILLFPLSRAEDNRPDRAGRAGVSQPVREAVSYRGLFTAGWFGVREKHCSRLGNLRSFTSKRTDCQSQLMPVSRKRDPVL